MDMRPFLTRSLVIVAVSAASMTATICRADDPPKKESIFSSEKFSGAPTYIKSKTLELRQDERVFTYKDRVEVTQDDMRMTSQKLVGTYDENNKIQEMVATGDVVVTKGAGLRSTGGRAVYKADAGTLILTEAPELQQNGSVLVADTVTILLDENRALADGNVKVKVLQSSSAKNTEVKDLVKK